MLSAVTWPDVALALIAIVPTTLAAIFAYLASIRAAEVKREIHLPSDVALGEQVEKILEVALANHYGIRRMNGEGNISSAQGYEGVTPRDIPDPDLRRPERGDRDQRR